MYGRLSFYGPGRVIFGETWRHLDLMESAGRVLAHLRRWEAQRVKVDVIGIGAGVVDRLREQGFRQVVGVNVARHLTWYVTYQVSGETRPRV